MCIYCSEIGNMFQNKQLDTKRIEELEKQNIISLYAGDCFTGEIIKHLQLEDHFTIENYYQCNNCKMFLYIGFCVRGLPVYKEYMSIEENWLKKLWGKVGKYYSIK